MGWGEIRPLEGWPYPGHCDSPVLSFVFLSPPSRHVCSAMTCCRSTGQKAKSQATMDWNLQNYEPTSPFPLSSLLSQAFCYSHAKLTKTTSQTSFYLGVDTLRMNNQFSLLNHVRDKSDTWCVLQWTEVRNQECQDQTWWNQTEEAAP
jgi:hypothetical protein